MTEKQGGEQEGREGQGNHKRASAAALIEAFARQYRTDREEAKSGEKHRIFREWLTIIGLFIAAVVAFFQWRELRSTDHNIAEQAKVAGAQLKEIREAGKQTDRSIAAFERMAQATQDVSEGTKTTVEQSRDASEKQLRAYIEVESTGKIVVEGTDIHIPIQMRNRGLTPAYQISVKSKAGYVKDVFELAAELKNYNVFPDPGVIILEDKPWLFPNGNMPADIDLPSAIANRSILKSPKSMIWICVLVEYSDTFNKPRTTEYCLKTLGSSISDLRLAAGQNKTINVVFDRVRSHAN